MEIIENAVNLSFERVLNTVGDGEIFLTLKCDNCCKFCSSANYAGEPTYEQIKHRIYQAKELDIKKINLTGGEPTLNPKIFEILNLIQRLNFETVQIKTNGRKLCNPEFAKHIATSQAPKYFLISLHGHSSGVHDFLTGRPGSFNETIRGIENLVNLTSLEIHTLTVITKQNYNHLPQIVELVQKLGVTGHNFAFTYPVANAHQNFDKVVPRYIEVSNKLIEALKLINKFKLCSSVDNYPPCLIRGFENYINFLRFKEIAHFKHPPCPAANNCSYGNFCESLPHYYVTNRGWNEIQPVIFLDSLRTNMPTYWLSKKAVPILRAKSYHTAYGGILMATNKIVPLKKEGLSILNYINEYRNVGDFLRQFGKAPVEFLFSLYQRGWIDFKAYNETPFYKQLNEISQCKNNQNYEYAFIEPINYPELIFNNEKITTLKNKKKGKMKNCRNNMLCIS